LSIVIFLLKGNSAAPFLSELSQLTFTQIIILYPISYGVGGFIISIVIALIYNQVSKITGGISLQLKKDSYFFREL
jgi:hypothetical protein